MSDQTQQEVTNQAPTVDTDGIVKEMTEWKEKAKAFEKQLKEKAEQEMRSRNEWQKIAEMKDQELKAAIEREQRIKDGLVYEKKYSAVKEQAAKMGLLPTAVEDLNILDLSEVVVETTSTGRYNVLGADKFAEKLKTIRPHWFGANQPNVNTQSVRVTGSEGPVTADDLVKADMEARKTGDKTKYYELFNKYKKQRSGR